MVGFEGAYLTYEFDKYFKILPAINNWGLSFERINDGMLVAKTFIYDSETNADWMSVDELSVWVQLNKDKLRIGN